MKIKSFFLEAPWHRVVMAVAWILIAISYWNALGGDFVYDDHMQIQKNPLIQSPANWLTAVTTDVWSFKNSNLERSSNYYRPTFSAWLIVNYTIFRTLPSGWHLGNILLHGLATYLAFLVLKRLKVAPMAAALVTWLFACHPIHVESVTWISGSPDILLASSLFFSLYQYLKVRIEPSWEGWGWVIMGAILGIGSKEAGSLFFLVIFVTEFVLSKQESLPRPFLRSFRNSLPFFAVAVGFVFLRYAVTHQFGASVGNTLSNASMFVSMPQTAAFYLRQALIPYELSSAYSLRTFLPSQIGLTNFWMPLLATVVALAGAVWAGFRNKISLIGIIFLVFVLPSFYFRALHPEHMARDRYFYLPLFAVLVAIACNVFKGDEIPWTRFRWNRASIVCAGIAFVLACQSMLYSRVWLNDANLWGRGVETDPNSTFALMNYCDALRVRNRSKEAIPYGLRSLEIKPNSARGNYIVGLAYRELKDWKNTEKHFRQALKIGGDSCVAAKPLGDLLVSQNRLQEAASLFETTISRDKNYIPAGSVNLAEIYYLMGRYPEALKLLESRKTDREILLVPEVQKGWFLLGKLYHHQGDNVREKECYSNYLAETAGIVTDDVKKLRTAANEYLGG